MPKKETAPTLERQIEDFINASILEVEERVIVQRETKALMKAMTQDNFSPLEIGKRLYNVQPILVRYGLFTWLLSVLSPYFRACTAYDYIKKYKRASGLLPTSSLDKSIAAYEPSHHERAMRGWEKRRRPHDPNALLLALFRLFDTQFKRLPGDKKDKVQFVRKLVGMMMSVIGIDGTMNFRATEVPDHMRGKVGRPSAKDVLRMPRLRPVKQ